MSQYTTTRTQMLKELNLPTQGRYRNSRGKMSSSINPITFKRIVHTEAIAGVQDIRRQTLQHPISLEEFQIGTQPYSFDSKINFTQNILGEARRFGQQERRTIDRYDNNRKQSVKLDLHLSPLNTMPFYLESPAAQSIKDNRFFSPNEAGSKTNNRKLKIHDTFTNIYPGYVHQSGSAFTKAGSHVLHPDYGDYHQWKGKWSYNHKMDDMKRYAESIFALKALAPEPRKAAPRS